MKLITWNCNMAFRKKAGKILAHHPDILVLQECEQTDRIIFQKRWPKPNSALWFGNNPHKGLAIFSFGEYKLKAHNWHNPNIRLVVPVSVRHERNRFTLFAIWAHNPEDPDGRYVEQVWKAVHHYEKQLSKPAILIGDFNSNTIWDKKYRKGNHSHVVEKLATKGITSSYHQFHNQVQGEEQHPTFYLYKHKNKPYHLDYCFTSSHFSDRLESVEIGLHRQWKKYSDHVPLIANFS
jgi:exodeoxyribonuclease-3